MRSLVRVCLVLFACLLSVLEGEAEKFQNPPFIATNGNGYYQILEGDLTGSGHKDLVYWSYGGPTQGTHYWYDVLLNQGKEAAGPRQFKDQGPVNFTSNGTSEAVLADVNEDGKLDLLFISWYESSGYSILFLAGNGDGTFAAPVISQISSGSFPNYDSLLEFFVADMNGDGHLDIAMSSGEPYEVQGAINVLQGDGTGRFKLEAHLTNIPANLMGVIDVNGDGLGDLVLWDFRRTNNVQVYLNTGKGQFRLETAYTLPSLSGSNSLSGVVFADMNGDGKLDIVCNDGFYLYVGAGNGDGTFQDTAKIPFETAGWLISAEDMNGDGEPDLVLLEDQGVTVLVKGSGFQFTPLNVALAGEEARQTVIGDLDGDGFKDVVVPDALPDATEGMSLLWGAAGGQLQSATGYRTQHFNSGGAMARFTLGPSPDIAVQPAWYPLPNLLENRGDGTFRLLPDPNPYQPPADFGPPFIYDYVVQTGDFNGDGVPDLLESGALETLSGGDYNPKYQVQTLPGQVSGVFGPAQLVPHYPDTVGYRATVAGDLNGDGISDIAINYQDEIDILLGKQGGGWTPVVTLINAAWDPQLQTLFGDFNGDGILDLAIADGNQLLVWQGRGDGTFNEVSSLTLPDGISGVPCIVADVDGDGNLDLLFTTNQGQYPIYGHGDGTFEAGTMLAMPGAQSAFATGTQVADVNRDGWPDLVIETTGGVVVRHGLGNRAWDQGDQYLSGGTEIVESAIWTQDLNNDGFPDIAMVDSGQQVTAIVAVLLNQPAPSDSIGSLSVNPEPQMQGANATATVVMAAGIAGESVPAGTVELTVDSVPAGRGLLVNGRVQIALEGAALLAPGKHWVVATYQGSSQYHAVRMTAAHLVLGTAPASTATTLTATPNPVGFGADLKLAAGVTTASGTVSGTVDFTEGGAVLGEASLGNSGSGSITLNTLAAGTHILVARYLGSTSFAPSSSASVTVVVQSPDTTTTLTAMPNPAGAGQAVSLQAQVSGASVATGVVSFYDGAVTLGSARLVNEAASLQVSFTRIGTHTITATYAGDAVLSGSTSAPLALVVTQQSSQVALTSSLNPAVSGNPVTFRAVVTSSEQAVPGGTVTFFDGTSRLGGPVSLTGGSATYGTSSLTLGVHAITAVYSGAAGVAGSTSPVLTEVIVAYVGDFSISATPANATFYTGESATFQVKVEATGGFNQPLQLSCIGLPATATCSFSPSSLPGGSGGSTLILKSVAPSKDGAARAEGPSAGDLSAARGLGLMSAGLGVMALVLFPTKKRRAMTRGGRMLVGFLVLAGLGGTAALNGCGAVTQIGGGTKPGIYTIQITAQTTQVFPALRHTAPVTVTIKSLF